MTRDLVNRDLVIRDPATGDEVGRVPVTPVAEIPRIVARARAAQPEWAALGLEGRRDALRPAGLVLVRESERIGRLLTREMGKPAKQAVGEVKHCGASLAETLDEIVAALSPERIEDARTVSELVFDPFGVCAAITPWNFPVSMPHWTVVPALVAGNTVVLKPSEKTPLVAREYAAILAAHLPADVLQVVHGDEAQGKALVDADVQFIAFTGSREAGRQILARAGADLKRVILELGGKDPLIVLDDADLEAAADFAAMNAFRNSGQVCVSTERIYVAEPVADRFEQLLAARTAAIQVGSGLDEATQVGPVVDSGQRDKILRQIDRAVQGGARVVAGGRGHHGNFVMPTVLAGVSREMPIQREETFGPVVTIERVRDDDAAVAAANDTPYGLGAAVFGRDLARAERVARRLTAGMVGINKGCGGAQGTPWVGAKQSGYGYHSGRDGHRQFAQLRVVSRARPASP